MDKSGFADTNERHSGTYFGMRLSHLTREWLFLVFLFKNTKGLYCTNFENVPFSITVHMFLYVKPFLTNTTV